MGNFKQALKEVFTGENESGDVKKNVKAVKDVKKESSSNGIIDNKPGVKKELKTIQASKSLIANKNSNSAFISSSRISSNLSSGLTVRSNPS
jgi:hypothetical protein